MWSKEATIQFIDAYRSFDCLWKVKSKDYCNKFLRDKAIEKLIEVAKEFDSQTNKDTITKKINKLRSVFAI